MIRLNMGKDFAGHAADGVISGGSCCLADCRLLRARWPTNLSCNKMRLTRQAMSSLHIPYEVDQ